MEQKQKKKVTLVYIDEGYTDFLRIVDKRVPYNMNYSYQRPFLGALFSIQNLLYFAPLTTSSKGKKLMDSPKQESLTFMPIENCKFGGINFNNMIPVVEGVYENVDLNYNKDDHPKIKSEKIKLNRMLRFLRKNLDHIILKAKIIYNKQIKGELFENYAKVTCDFKKLEEQSKAWSISALD